MRSRREVVRTGLAAGALGLGSPVSLAWAQSTTYPSEIIHSLCMFAPGSGADVKVRFYANKLAQKIGQAVVVENRPGAMGYIATEAVARARPDGYTIYIAPGSSMLAAAPYLFKTLKFDPIRDFEHITTLNFSAFVLCVSGSRPFANVADLTAYLKQKGAAASFGSIAPPGLVASEMYKAKFGLETVEVKYRDQSPLIVDLLNGVIDFTHIDYITVAGLIMAGQVRPLALASAQALAAIPGVPGAEAAGIPDMNIRNWWSVHVPARTPRAICDKLEALFNAIAIEPDTIKFLADNGSDPMPVNAAMLKELLVQETKDWSGYAKLARIEPI